MKFSVTFKADAVRKMIKDLEKEFKEGADGAKAGYEEGKPHKGTSATMSEIALANEFGFTAHIPPHKAKITTYKEVNKKGTDFNKDGRFVKKSKSNFAQDYEVDVKGYDVTVHSRPFLRNAEAKIQERAGKIMKAGMQGGKTLNRIIAEIAQDMRTQVVESITSNTPPENKPSTVKQKGSSHTLIDTGQLRDSVRAAVVKKGRERMIGK